MAGNVSRMRRILLGALSALVALLPWMVQGMQLPLQNLGVADQGEQLALLPFNQYYVEAIFAMLTIGMAGAALIARRGGAPRGYAFLGASIVQGVAIAQSTFAANSVMSPDSRAFAYMLIMFAAIMACWLYAIITFWLVAARHPAALVIGSVFAALALGAWLDSFLASASLAGGLVWAVYMLDWVLPCALVGISFGWAWPRLTTVNRWILPIISWLLLFVGRAGLGAAIAVAGTRSAYNEYFSTPKTLLRDLAQNANWLLRDQPIVWGTIVLITTSLAVIYLQRGGQKPAGLGHTDPAVPEPSLTRVPLAPPTAAAQPGRSEFTA